MVRRLLFWSVIINLCTNESSCGVCTQQCRINLQQVFGWELLSCLNSCQQCSKLDLKKQMLTAEQLHIHSIKKAGRCRSEEFKVLQFWFKKKKDKTKYEYSKKIRNVWSSPVVAPTLLSFVKCCIVSIPVRSASDTSSLIKYLVLRFIGLMMGRICWNGNQQSLLEQRKIQELSSA